MSAKKVIVTVATTGAFHGKKANPALPEQPDEIAQAAYDCWNAGASVVHIHARDKQGKVTNATETYREINTLIRAKSEIIIQNSTAPAVDWANARSPLIDMDEGLQAIDAGPEMCSLDLAILAISYQGKANYYYTWTRDWMRKACKMMNDKGIKPEIELFSPVSIEDMKNVLIAEGLLKPPYSCTMVMGQHTISQGAMEYSPENLMFMRSQLPANTSYTVMAVAQAQLPATTLGMLVGANVRVGFEDNIYYARGELAKSNAQLVERAVRQIREFGMEVATPAEAREMLGIPQLK